MDAAVDKERMIVELYFNEVETHCDSSLAAVELQMAEVMQYGVS